LWGKLENLERKKCDFVGEKRVFGHFWTKKWAAGNRWESKVWSFFVILLATFKNKSGQTVSVGRVRIAGFSAHFPTFFY